MLRKGRAYLSTWRRKTLRISGVHLGPTPILSSPHPAGHPAATVSRLVAEPGLQAAVPELVCSALRARVVISVQLRSSVTSLWELQVQHGESSLHRNWQRLLLGLYPA